MDSTVDPSGPLLGQLLWAGDAATQHAILLVLGVAVLAFAVVYLPLLVRLFRVGLLERSVRDACHLDDRPGEEHRREISDAFAESPLAWHWDEFLYRWRSAQTEGPRERAPVRLLDVFEQRPILPSGARTSLLPALPGLFLAVGVLGTIVGLVGAVSQAAPTGADPAITSSALVDQVGLALRTSLWGMALAIVAAMSGRLLEGAFEQLAESLDHWVERAYGSVSVGELTTLTARHQRAALEGLGAELSRFTSDLSERIDRGLGRIEDSTASAASLVSEEQRAALQTVVRELSQQVQRGVQEHLEALHNVLERAVDHQGAVTGGLAEAFEQMTVNAHTHAQVTQILAEAATAVQSAAGSISGTAHDMTPVLEHLRETGNALQHTAASMQGTQDVVAHSADGIRSSIKAATDAMNEQREFIETGLDEIRATLRHMSTGLGENLSRALREVDDALSRTVGRLRETLDESNETIERMAQPVRAAEGTTREMQTALERVRDEVAALGDWLNQAVRPVRSTLSQLEDRSAEITRALVQFGDRAIAVDKTMDALRGEIHEEGRRLRASSSELGRHLQRAAEAVDGMDAPSRAPLPAGVPPAAPPPAATIPATTAQPEPRSEAGQTGPIAAPAPRAAGGGPPPSGPIAPHARVETAVAAGATSGPVGPRPPATTTHPATTGPIAPASRTAPAGEPAPGAAQAGSTTGPLEASTGPLGAGFRPLDPPDAGRQLGPDPYARLEIEGATALERQERLLEQGRAMHPFDLGDGGAAEDLSLSSGLLGPRSRGAAQPAGRERGGPEPTDTQPGEAERAPGGGEEDPPAQDPTRPAAVAVAGDATDADATPTAVPPPAGGGGRTGSDGRRHGRERGGDT